MSIQHSMKSLPAVHPMMEMSACAAACALTGIELAETGVGYVLWCAWCINQFCED